MGTRWQDYAAVSRLLELYILARRQMTAPMRLRGTDASALLGSLALSSSAPALCRAGVSSGDSERRHAAVVASPPATAGVTYDTASHPAV